MSNFMEEVGLWCLAILGAIIVVATVAAVAFTALSLFYYGGSV